MNAGGNLALRHVTSSYRDAVARRVLHAIRETERSEQPLDDTMYLYGRTYIVARLRLSNLSNLGRVHRVLRLYARVSLSAIARAPTGAIRMSR